MHRFEKWRDALRLAPDTEALAKLIMEYIATLRPLDVDGLPEPCKSLLTNPKPDIQGAAVVCLQEELMFMGKPEIAAVLHEIAHTFAAASIRLGQLQGRSEPITRP